MMSSAPHAQEDDPAVVRRLDHVGIVVRDIEIAARYWVERLGMQRAHTADVLDGSVRLAYLDAGDSTVQLVQPLQAGPLQEHLDLHGEGLHHVCFLVNDIPSALERLSEEPRQGPYVGGYGADVAFITTKPCGVLVELTEPTTTEGREAAQPRERHALGQVSGD